MLIYLKEEGSVPAAAEDADRLRSLKRNADAAPQYRFREPPPTSRRSAADLHNWLFDKYMVRHHRGQYFAKASELHRRVPGRWRSRYRSADERRISPGDGETHGPARTALVAAPAGRGKSALLVH